MKNITVAVDDEVYRRARIVAAERSTSVSALVREYWRALAAPDDCQDQASAALFSALDLARELCAADRLSHAAAHER